MDISVLEGLGLSRNEIAVFVKLLQIGESKAGTIIAETNLQSSATYNSINSLINKGLVSFILKNKIKYYKAAEPETILDYIETKKREYLKLLPELKQAKKDEKSDSVEYYKSYNGIKTLVFEMLSNAKPGDIYRYFGIETKHYKMATKKVYSQEKTLRIQKKIRTIGILPESSRSVASKSKTTVKRFLSNAMPPNTLIINNKVAIISWEGEPSGILIRSKDIYQTYVNFFEEIWKIAKK